MSPRGVVCLLRQILLNRRRGSRLTTVPHDRTQELEIGGRQRPSVHRDRLEGRAAGVWVVYRQHLEFGAGGHVHGDTDQTFREQHAVRCGLITVHRVDAIAVGSVVAPENRIRAVRFGETCLDVLRRDGPAVSRLMARHAPASVGPEILEERVIQVDRSVHVQRPDLAGGILERRQVGVLDVPEDLRADRDRYDPDPHCDAHANEWLRFHERPPACLRVS